MFMIWDFRIRDRGSDNDNNLTITTAPIKARELASLLDGRSAAFGQISTMQTAVGRQDWPARNCRPLNNRGRQQRSRHELLRGFPAANIW